MTAMPVFGSFIRDFALIFLIGAIGGMLFALLMERGLSFPSKVYANERLILLRFGFLGDMIVGGVTAASVYALNPPVSQQIFIVIGIIAGIGGSAVLTAYIRTRESDEAREKKVLLAERYRAAVARHAGPVMSQGNMQLLNLELMEIDEQLLG